MVPQFPHIVVFNIFVKVKKLQCNYICIIYSDSDGGEISVNIFGVLLFLICLIFRDPL